MGNEIFWVLTCSVKPGKFDGLKKLVDRLVVETTSESGSLSYVFSANADQTEIKIFERYRDSAAVMEHLTQTFPKHREQFLDCVEVTSRIVFGVPDTTARERLDSDITVFMTPFAGFMAKD